MYPLIIQEDSLQKQKQYYSFPCALTATPSLIF